MTVINHWGKWRSSELPTTGVVSMNNLEWIDDEINNGIDLSYDGALEQYIEEEIAEWQEKIGDLNALPSDDLKEEWIAAFDYDSGGESEYLIGSWVRNEEGKYSPDRSGDYAAIALCGSNVVIVEWSKYITRAAMCSPCYPGSADLDTEGDFMAYDLPMAIYGDFRQNDNGQEERSATTEVEAQA